MSSCVFITGTGRLTKVQWYSWSEASLKHSQEDSGGEDAMETESGGLLKRVAVLFVCQDIDGALSPSKWRRFPSRLQHQPSKREAVPTWRRL